MKNDEIEDGDDVVEYLRPTRGEARRLVERPSSKAGGAAGLGEVGGRLRVCHRGHDEDDPGDQEGNRGQAEREDGDEAKRVIDGGADVAVGGRRECPRAEHALEADAFGPEPGHAPMFGNAPLSQS
jgi:hypothetical protein